MSSGLQRRRRREHNADSGLDKLDPLVIPNGTEVYVQK